MEEMDRKIQLMLTPQGKRGVVMMKENYSLLSEFIMETIKHNENVRLNDLLEKARQKAFPGSANELSWSLLQVKLDLEARGLIAMQNIPKTHSLPFIRLTRKGTKAIRAMNNDQ